MNILGASALQVVEVVGLGALAFAVVIVVCAAVLAMLQLILPSTDSGAVAADEALASREAADDDVDTEVNA